MIHVMDAPIKGVSLWRKGEAHYICACTLKWHDGDPIPVATWYGPLTDAERGAFYRLTKVQEVRGEPE